MPKYAKQLTDKKVLLSSSKYVKSDLGIRIEDDLFRKIMRDCEHPIKHNGVGTGVNAFEIKGTLKELGIRT